jgi:PAS domain S-box-containing protein
MSERVAHEPMHSALLRWLDELAAQGIFTTDASLSIQSWNRWLEHHTGIAADHAIGRGLLDLFPDLARRGLDGHYRAAIAGEARVLAYAFHRYLLPGRPGTAEPAQSARIAPLQAEGTIVGTITVIDDVSDRVASERELRNQIEMSETARRIAEQASAVKDEFLATLSHEIRTPLSAVIGWTKILLGQAVDPAMLTRALQIIDRNAIAQMRLIDDMLDMARVMSGKLRLEIQPVDLAAITFAAIDVVAPTAAAKRLQIETAVNTDAPWMMGDPDRLQQIVWNLLSNAIKFTESGGTIAVKVSRESDFLHLSITDTGRGIDAAFLPQVFERFRQADPSSSRRHGGLGLGLALVRQLVEMHGGKVSATSAVGEGSTFTVVFPGRTDLSVTDEGAAEPLPATALAGVHVLLVEDEADAREIVVAILQHHGAVVNTARTAAEALTALDGMLADGSAPDVIISDIGLPDEDGYRLMEQLARRPGTRGGRVPVVALTAYGRPQDRKRALAAGFRLHLVKPVEPQALAAAIRSVLSPRGR